MEAVLEHAMASPGLMAAAPRWRIWHPLKEPCASDPGLARALLRVSDHFPVTLDLEP